MFLKSIHFKQNIVFESNRDSQEKMFKVKIKKYTTPDYRKPIYETSESLISRNRSGNYEMKEVIERTFIIFKKDLLIEFEPITVIVGDNGCGKTSLVEYLKYPHEKIKGASLTAAFINKSKEEVQKDIIKEWLDDKERKLTFIGSPHYIVAGNELHKSAFIDNAQKEMSEKTLNRTLKASSIASFFDMQEASNGENNLDFLFGLKEISNSLIILDEPETSLSIKSQFKIFNLLKELSQSNQIIIITHNENLMRLSDNVYDFEKKNYILTEKYINQQKKLANNER